jgi:hypothetical protein
VKQLRVCLAPAIAVLLLVASTLAGCGQAPSPSSEQQAVVDKAIKAAIAGENLQFLPLVAPSFREEAARQMPDATNEELAAVLVSGFLEGLPFASIKSASYETEVEGDKAVVHLWGVFTDSGGEEVNITQTDALRIPLVNEGSRWYLDLLDI